MKIDIVIHQPRFPPKKEVIKKGAMSNANDDLRHHRVYIHTYQYYIYIYICEIEKSAHIMIHTTNLEKPASCPMMLDVPFSK